ncbi:hypothetical protein HMPREF1862_00815 [Varibaculum cambriense]|uniref:Uncharacterized protein n=1 Tax=Varibaculum cambriense TaxID=184870 RepID=A0AB34X057_9ACTO|nr:hypothetical protein HMPREF1862_00815 [Varibaculum cambriense]
MFSCEIIPLSADCLPALDTHQKRAAKLSSRKCTFVRENRVLAH